MRVLILKQNVTDQITLDKGLEIARQKCASVGLPIDFIQMGFDKQLKSIPFSNATNQNGYYIDPQSLIGPWVIGYDQVCIVYDWTKISPQPTNPTDNGQVIQIPIEWFESSQAVPPEQVFAEFYLHELCHYFFNTTGKPDITHTYDPAFSQKPRMEWYLYLLKGMIPLTSSTPTATITRGIQDTKQTLGTLTAKNGGATFNCKTLELPYLGNVANISCIPKGTYQVTYTFSLRLLKYTYEIQNVSGRSGIRFHSANFFSDLKGCIALGDSLVDLNKDSELDVANSRATIQTFERFFNKKSFTLIIT